MAQFKQSDALQRLPTQFFASLVKKVEHLKQAGHDVINLGQGNPDMPTPAHIVEKLKEAAEKPANHKYSPFRGRQELKEATASFYRREYNVDVDPDTEVAILFGAKTGLVEISQCLLNEGDTVLLPDPGYPDYLSGTALAGAHVETMPLVERNHFLPDYHNISREIREKAKLMFLNYPNNPTAAAADRSFFDQTVAFAKQHQIGVVHDFAYGAIGFGSGKPQSFLQSPGAAEVGVEMYTLSKTYNMAGWRVGMAVGNASMIEAVNLLQDHLYVSLFGAVQEAAVHALNSGQRSVQQLVNTYESRRHAFMSSLQASGWDVRAPQGTFFAWLPVPKGYTSEQFADVLLEKCHVAVAPGRGFGEHGEGYVRVGLLDSEERLQEAGKRIAQFPLE
ncbi:aminotransferase [Alteribacillus persepolensis]|uniref:Aminotransferase n=1 Tax=Alteribacillus persepolensis TaxID=568899 RepID=A0A1G8B178_9BACI|nr:pyridoxal phosphate-dependent aminotransferase [Alteribacillus persepolensis]SDH27019.1 aminotransferase [Alteribacillus persepolensis]